MPRDKKDVQCYTRVGGKSGKKFTTCVDKTNAQLQKGKSGMKAKPHEGKYKPEPTPKKNPAVTQPEQLRKLSVVELRKLARGRGMRGSEVSLMNKSQLVQMLAKQPKRKVGGGTKEQSPDRKYDMTKKRGRKGDSDK